MNRPRGRGKSTPALALLALWALAAVVLFAAPAERAAAQTGPSTPVNIPDPVLRAKLAAGLGRSSGATITRADMALFGPQMDLRRASSDRSNPALAIRDLTGLEYAVSVRSMYLAYNEISNLTPLAGLTSLTTLSLNRNRISDLTPLAGLTSLRVLRLDFNQISNISPLAGLTSLDQLNLDDNQISDLGPLAGRTSLTELVISDNRISDISPLRGLPLENLFAGYNRITDLRPLENMNSLAYLVLTGNEDLKDLSPLSGITGLNRLSVDGTSIEDLAPLVASVGFQASFKRIDLRHNSNLNDDAAGHIQTLRDRGITVFASEPTSSLAVRGLSVTPGVRQLEVSWQPLTTSGVQGYLVQWKPGTQHLFADNSAYVAGAGTTTYTIPDLTPGVEYGVRVRARPSGPPTSLRYATPWSAEQIEEARRQFEKALRKARDRALGTVLAGMGRTIAADAVDMVEERFDRRQGGGGAQVALGGLALTSGTRAASGGPAPAAPEPRAGTERVDGMDPGGEGSGQASVAELLSRSSFDLPLSGQDAPGAANDLGWRLWGRGTAGGFEGKPAPGFSMEGKVSGGYVGLDWRPHQDMVSGMAIGHISGEADYEADAAMSTDGAVDLEMTILLPWAHWEPRPDLGVWGLLGAGSGDVGLKDEVDEAETELKMRMAAFGLRQEVAAWRGIDMAVKADTFLTEMRTDAARRLSKSQGAAKRLRLRVEGRTEWDISAVSRVASALDIGGRWDGGDAETGLGAEVGGSLAYAHTGLGLAVDARGRYLLAHRESALKEWGGSLTAKLDPGQAGVGPSLKLTPGWGVEGSRVAQIWDGSEAFHPQRGADGTSGLSPDRLALDAGYGLTYRGTGLLTPYAGLSMARPSVRGYKAGARLEVGDRLALGVEGKRSVWAAGSARNAVMVHGRVSW